MAVRILAQTNPPVKLALISETDEALPAADLLTAKFSGNDQIQLLERDQIEKVYQEQGLSAANTDYLKLGHLLGADGILLLNVVRTPQATNLMARLIAVKPGVILSDAGFDWPLKDTVQWSDSAAAYLNTFLPKLTVLPKEAIPISVVNLRSAISSSEAAETERQLKLLVIQRLSQERQLFVLERQKMQLLSDEKGLKADDSAFWDGSYLLEGVVDQNGYSPDTVTINARLTPPKGGAPVQFAVSGSRTNLTEVINQLAAQVNDALKIQSTAPAWNAADEAAQFLKEAQWALRWGLYTEAQSAADSAWALGKQDLDCALVRVRAYVAEVMATTSGLQNGESALDPAGNYDANNHPLGSVASAAKVQEEIAVILKEHPFGAIYRVHEANGAKIIDYSFALQPPEPENIDRALRALEMYYEFSRNSPDGQPKILWSGEGWNDWHDSDWYQMGITDLVAASEVLQDFNFVPETQKPVADKLAELRAMARSVAKLISGSPTVHDSYFVGDRVVTHDELAHTMEESPGIFRCEVKWGCFWQETPEDGVALYRELLASPVFSYIHTDFWLRELQTPRLVGWNENDRQRTPQVWDRFLNELENSTNALWRLEARALTLADEENEQKLAAAFTNFLNGFSENRDALVANNVELLYLNWGADNLVSAKTDSGPSDELTESLHQLYHSQYSPKLEAMDQEYWNKTIPAQKTVAAFKKQKQYLADFTPYDFQSFAQIFSANNYTKAQAAELKPLIVAYKSNLLARAAAPDEKFKARSDTQWIELTLEKPVDQILEATAPQNSPAQSPEPPKIQTHQPVAVAPAVVPASVITPSPEAVTNAITVGKFLAIPLDALLQAIGLGTIDISKTNIYLADISITGHQWLEGKLLLNLDYGLADQRFGNANGFAIALFDPATEHWEVIHCPDEAVESQNRFYHRSVLLRGELFTCAAGQIQKYNFQNQQWEVLNISDGNNYELFAINGQLYAANQNVILEIIDGGKSTRILASTRRQPPASALDTQEWGTPILFAGPDHSLRVYAGNKLYTYANNDWRADSAAPAVSSLPEVFTDGVLFRQSGFLEAGYANNVITRQANGTYGLLLSQDKISCLPNEAGAAKLYLAGTQDDWRNAAINRARPGAKPVQALEPLCTMPADLLPNQPAALRQSDLYIFEDPFAVHAIVNERHEVIQENSMNKDDYNAALLCFSPDFLSPQKVYLKFDGLKGSAPGWMLPTTNLLIFGNASGIWLMPLSSLDSMIAAQKQIQLSQQTQAIARVKQAQQNLFAKYDRNHNGVIDPDEREAALDDPAFIASQLDLIDANHNGQLDPEELIYFDANQNKILEPKEQAGIKIAQHLLAERDLKKFAVDGVAFLNQQEFEQLLSRPGTINKFRMDSDFRNADDNQDGKIDVSELEAYLQQQLQRKIRPRGAAAAALIQAQIQRGQRMDAKELFKEELEIYWQNSGSATNP